YRNAPSGRQRFGPRSSAGELARADGGERPVSEEDQRRREDHARHHERTRRPRRRSNRPEREVAHGVRRLELRDRAEHLDEADSVSVTCLVSGPKRTCTENASPSTPAAASAASAARSTVVHRIKPGRWTATATVPAARTAAITARAEFGRRFVLIVISSRRSR